MNTSNRKLKGRAAVKSLKGAGAAAPDKTPVDTPRAGAGDAPDPNRWPRMLPWQPVFLATLELRGNVRAAAAEAGITRSWAYAARASDPAFAAAWKEALEDAMDRLEEEAWNRAVDGRAKPVYQGGKLVGYVQEYSDPLMVTLLKAHRPEKYRENVEVKHDVSDPLAELMRQIRSHGGTLPAAG